MGFNFWGPLYATSVNLQSCDLEGAGRLLRLNSWGGGLGWLRGLSQSNTVRYSGGGITVGYIKITHTRLQKDDDKLA